MGSGSRSAKGSEGRNAGHAGGGAGVAAEAVVSFAFAACLDACLSFAILSGAARRTGHLLCDNQFSVVSTGDADPANR